MAETVKRLGVRREPGYLYFLRGSDVWKTPMKRAGGPAAAGKASCVARSTFEREEGYLYFLDSAGNIARAKRAVAGQRRKTPSRIDTKFAHPNSDESRGGTTRSADAPLSFEFAGVTVTEVRNSGAEAIAALAALTELSPARIRKALDSAHGNTLVENLFSDDWPDPALELGGLSVAKARDLELAAYIADLTDLAKGTVSRRLNAAHGRTLVRNLFAEFWPESDGDAGDGEGTIGEVAVGPATATRRSTHGATASAGGTVEPAGDTWTAGSVVDGKWRITRELGRGGYGVAFEAVDLHAQSSLVVLKTSFGSDGIKSLRKEYELARKLSKHPNICTYLQLAERPNVFLVMEHGGQSVHALVRERGPFAPHEALRIAREVASALQYAHDQGVIHRDINPGNVLVDDDGAVKVADFGISSNGEAKTVANGGHTVLATTLSGFHPLYGAPEVVLGMPAHRSSDQYSLALVLCTMLEGEILTSRYEPHEIPSLTARQNAAIRRAIEMKHGDRFASCMDFARELAE